jgi:hypothetical protein
MSHANEQSESKKPYEIPHLITINLRPDEAVLGHCKSVSSGTYQMGGCAIIFGACNSVGS